jgi:hypothetical protein
MVSRSRHFLVAALAALILPSTLPAGGAAASPAGPRASPPAAANVNLTVGNATLTEAATNLEFTITLSQKPTAEVFVFYETVDRTAAEGADFKRKYGWLSFSTTQRTRTVRVPVLDDAAGEITERMTLKVTRITGPVTIADGTAVGTIKDADPNHLVVKVDSGGAPAFGGLRSQVLLEPGGHECYDGTPCDLTFPDGTAVSLTADPGLLPFSIIEFQGWGGDACTAADETCSFIIKGDTETTAVFSYVPIVP